MYGWGAFTGFEQLVRQPGPIHDELCGQDSDLSISTLLPDGGTDCHVCVSGHMYISKYIEGG